MQKGVPRPFGAIKNQRSLVYVGNLANAIICLKHLAAAGQMLPVPPAVLDALYIT